MSNGRTDTETAESDTPSRGAAYLTDDWPLLLDLEAALIRGASKHAYARELAAKAAGMSSLNAKAKRLVRYFDQNRDAIAADLRRRDERDRLNKSRGVAYAEIRRDIAKLGDLLAAVVDLHRSVESRLERMANREDLG